MKFSKGLHTDANEQDQPEDSYIWALNWVVSEKFGSLVSERGFEYKFQLRDGFQPLLTLPTADKVVIMSTNGVESEIGIYDESTEVYTPRLNNTISAILGGGSDTGLNFSLKHQIKGTYRYNSKGDLEIAFTDWNMPPRIITIPNDIADMAVYYTPYNINKLNIFQTALFNKIETTIQTSGTLISDAYFVFYRYKNVDFTVTNIYVHPEPHYIIIDNIFDEYSDITGNDIGSPTNKSIQVIFGTLDSTFPSLEIGLYRVSTAEAKIITTIPTNQSSATLTSFNGETIPLGTVLAPRLAYSKAKTLTSLNNVLYLGNLSKNTFDVPQKYVNNLKLKWTCKMVDPSEAKKNKDYNNPLRTFMANEIYSYFIRYISTEGDYTQWKHLAGRKAVTDRSIVLRILTPNHYHPDYGTGGTRILSVNERAAVNHAELTNYQGAYYQTVDTCTITSYSHPSPGSVPGTPASYMEGDFGYWENEAENYLEYFSGEDLDIVSSAGTMLGKLNDIGNSNVRHHKFPSLRFIEKSLPEVGFTSADGISVVSHFAGSYPQFGVKFAIDPLDLLPDDLKARVKGYEIGFTARDFNNCSVYGQDLSLFGVYAGAGIRNAADAFDLGATDFYGKPQANFDAVYFTGGNTVGSGISKRSHTISFAVNGDIILTSDSTNVNNLQNWTHSPFTPAQSAANVGTQCQMPNRQRFFTPDLVDPLFPTKNPNITPTHIRHEVMIVTGQREVTTSQNPSEKSLYYTESGDSNYDSNNHYALIDYCGVPNRDASVNNKNTDAQYSTWCLRNIPDRWIHRNIKASGYVVKGTKGIVIGDSAVINAGFNYNTGGGELYGGSDHYHVQLYDKYFPKTPIAEEYAASTIELFSLYKSFLTRQPYSGAGLDTIYDPFNLLFYNKHPVPSLNFSLSRGTIAVASKQHHAAFICSIQKHVTSIYNKFSNLGVINALPIPQDGEIFTGYGGDCFISEVHYVVHATGCPRVFDNYVAQNFMAYRFYAHTRKNLDYRYEKNNDPGLINKYYPASRWNAAYVFPDVGPTLTAEIFYGAGLQNAATKTQPYQAFNYNTVFGTPPNFTTVSSIYSNETNANNLNNFLFRVHSSETQAKESALNNWRVFLALNYYENDKTKGEITNLQGYDDKLLIHTVQSLFVTKDRGNLENSALGITIGTGGLFDFPPEEAIFNKLGYTGTQHQFGCEMTKLGYVFPDAQQGKYFIYNKKSGTVELSNVGVFNYFKKYGKTIHNDYYDNNASGLSAWSAVFDEYNNRLLIGYRNKLEDYPLETKVDPKSFTLSYSDTFKNFTSFHSYYPTLITSTRTNVYSFDGNKFYKHNTPNRGYYDGVSVRNEIDLLFNTTPITTKNGTAQGGVDYLKLWQSFNWASEIHSYQDSSVFNLETFDQASVRTKKQCSDLKDLVPFQNTRQFKGNWYFNQFRDRLLRTGARAELFTPFTEDLNSERRITYPNNTEFNSRFIDTYAILRLIYNSTNPDRELHLLNTDYTNQIVSK